ncbi:hypothetical protein ABBQ38_014067 [Trebouxia sp. C0009 RCD-2024]
MSWHVYSDRRINLGPLLRKPQIVTPVLAERYLWWVLLGNQQMRRLRPSSGMCIDTQCANLGCRAHSKFPPITIVQMANRPTGVDEAIEFVWSQPDTVLQSSEKQSLTAILAKETDVVARRYFLAPLPEQWVGTLKELLPPRGLTPRFDLLERLLRPLEQLPRKDQFFAFLTTQDGRVIPVSGLAYNTKMVHWHILDG